MRLSTQYMFKQSIDSMSQRISQNNDAYIRLSAGKTLIAASDDPGGASDAVLQQNVLAKIELYANARSAARGHMEHVDATLSSAGNLLNTNLSKTLVAAMNGTMSQEDLAVLGEEIDGIAKNLLELANTRDGSSRYLFSGFKSGTAPFDAQGNYQGGDTPRTQSVAEGSDMQIGLVGSDIFNSGTPDDLFKNLQAAVTELTRDPLDKDQVKLALGAASKAVDAGIDSLGKAQAQLGTHLQQLDALDMQSDIDRNAAINKLQSALGSDYGTQINLMNDAKVSEFAMNASMMVFQAMQKMTLFRS